MSGKRVAVACQLEKGEVYSLFVTRKRGCYCNFKDVMIERKDIQRYEREDTDLLRLRWLVLVVAFRL